MNAFIKFHKGLLRSPLYVQFWLGLLVSVNAVIPLFYLPRVEAVTTIVVFMINFMLMIVITHFFGFTRLLGAGHLLWLPLIVFLWMKLDFATVGSFYVQWMIAVIVLNGISLVIDVVDTVRYLAGDKDEIIAGL